MQKSESLSKLQPETVAPPKDRATEGKRVITNFNEKDFEKVFLKVNCGARSPIRKLPRNRV